jgi:hypothetical protein
MDELVAVKLAQLDERIAALDRLVSSQFANRDERSRALMEGLNARLFEMNKFRQVILDQQTTFLQKAEYNAHHSSLEGDIKRAQAEHEKFAQKDEVNELRKQVERNTGKLSVWDGRVWAIGTIFVVIQLIITYLLDTMHVTSQL